MYLKTESKDNNITFTKIKHVLIVNEYTIAFLCLEVKIVSFSQHFQSFEIEDTNRWSFVIQKELTDFSPLNRQMMPNGKYYVPLSPNMDQPTLLFHTRKYYVLATTLWIGSTLWFT
ncbi:hypothetical protein PV328_006061 [Microctonus aethiopoides]|uniref:Uncharacterized protein n=1 Tax=Microctonus aethiopoides TaxID=144406 RepID=A0AA39FNB7_9HYME|nr:hypothetical protein PV328_006061 [Microctonus aethiopoides]